MTGLLALALASSVVAAPAPAAPSPAPVAAPAKAADYSVVDLDGIKKLMRKVRGRVVLVHFWASWCGPCLEELPVVDRLARELKPRGLEVLSLSLDNPRTAGPRVGSLLRRVAPNLTTTIAKFDDADSFISAFSAGWEGAIPALFAYDQQGELRGTLIGESSREDDKFWQTVRARPGSSVRDVRAKFRDIDRRIADIETHVTSQNSALAREIDALR